MLISTSALTFFSLSLSLSLSLAAPVAEHLAPLRRAVDVGGNNPSGGYIVSIKPNTVDPNNRLHWLTKVLTARNLTLDEDAKQALKFKWSEDVFNGIAGIFSTDALNVLRQQPEVAWIEEDIEMHTTGIATQVLAPWGIARLSNGPKPVKPGIFGFRYSFNTTAGSGTDAYILDTGCRVTHTDFGGRASCFPRDISCEDLNGHGTHVTGTIGGTNYGVAKNANLYCVKAMEDNGSGSVIKIISSLNAAVVQARATGKPSVISMSLGGPSSSPIDNAVSGAISQGIPVIAAAGNQHQDANNISPARLDGVITVGATTIDDTFASFSNFGEKVDILAPGKDILSASNLNDHANATLSGTSQAAPHISGLALLLMGMEGKQLNPSDLAQRLVSLARPNVIKDVPTSTKNMLAFNGVLVVHA